MPGYSSFITGGLYVDDNWLSFVAFVYTIQELSTPVLKKAGFTAESSLFSVWLYLLGFYCVQSTVFKRVSADRLIAI